MENKNRGIINLSFLFVFIFISISNGLLAQRPKVGLVLSGGGAKGISHVGILQAIDSAGLKIDYVTGTSMGSIIGGLYSIGYSGKEIEKISDNLDWDVILSNKPNYPDISIDEKDEYGKYSVEVGLKGLKPQIATGLIESEELWLKLNELFLPVYNIKDFSKFNIPFKCVATDLSNGKAVVLDKGEIVTALRSSMAIPSVFTAIDYDSTKLVDGGIIRNFPVTDIKDMGADIVIGVNLFLGLPDVSKLNNVLDVFYQITQYRDAEDLVMEKELCDLVIEPPVEDYSAGSFGSIDEIMKIGKEIGKKYYPYFKHLADSLNSLYPVDYSPENRLPARESIIIDSIGFEGLEHTSESFLLDKIQIIPGKTYTAMQINKGFRKAYSSRYYDKVYYELIPTTHGHANLKCIVQETLLTQVKMGLSYHSYTGASLIANVTIRNLLLDKSRSMVKFAISENLMFLAEHKQAFGKKGNKYINMSFHGLNLPINIYENKQIASVYRVHQSQFDINFARTFGTNWYLASGINYQKNNFKPEVADNLKVKGNTNNWYAYFRTEAKTTDRRLFPTSGYEFLAESGVAFHRKAEIGAYNVDGTTTDVSGIVNGQPEFYRIMLNFSKFHPLNPRLVFLYNLQAGLSLNSQGFIFDDFYMGGVQKLNIRQMPFVGINETQIISSSVGSALLGLQYNLSGKFYFTGKVNTGIYDFSTEDKFYDSEKVKVINGASLGIGYNLDALPMEITTMYSPETGAFYAHFKIGVLF
ncbi:MAG TPA: patatin-like phospholipase family protein [Draconibacterium sp.]|nr:patatin-like phospholipase family protein [Draconibacterium sp.]